MLSGTADVTRLAQGAPELCGFRDETLVLENVEILQITWELAGAAVAGCLPPALHPTIPALATWLVWRCPEGPLGRFALAQTRVSTRSGVRPRAFLFSAVIEGEEAARPLAAEWGYRCLPGEVRLQRGYDRITVEVRRDGRTILATGLYDPDPLRNDDVQYTANMNLARTPNGLRLVQVDPDFRVHRAERGTPRLERFDGGAWGASGLVPQDPVAASFAVADVVLPRIRYVCRPDVSAFEGTETVGGTRAQH